MKVGARSKAADLSNLLDTEDVRFEHLLRALLLYTARVFGPISIRTSPESDGATWTDYNTQTFGQGPYQLAFDRISGIMYASMWN